MKWLMMLVMIVIIGVSCLLNGCSATENRKDADEEAQAKKYALVDLHLHLDGSLSVATVRELADMQKIEIPEDDQELLDMLQVDADCRDLNEYLEKFDITVSLLQTKEALSTAVYNLEEELRAQALLYAEIRFAPQLHTEQGLSQAEIVEAAIAGMNRSEFRSNLILCCMRGDDNREQNLETVRIAKKYLGKGVCAVDIAGAEALYPTENFEDVFQLAKELGVPYTIHAGEADGAQSVYKALEFGTKRVGHGVRSVEDDMLIKRLADEGITLELCPTSNMNTNIFESMEEYPIRKLLDAGVRVTINTDNMTVSGTTLQSEFRKMIDTFALTDEELKQLAKNSVNASFADQDTKKLILDELKTR